MPRPHQTRSRAKGRCTRGGLVKQPGGEDDAAQAAPLMSGGDAMTFPPPCRPSGRSVWLGKDRVRTADWMVRLSRATPEEIAAAVDRLRGRNAYDTPVAREEFPLATMADELARMRREIATGRGFFVFRGLDR